MFLLRGDLSSAGRPAPRPTCRPVRAPRAAPAVPAAPVTTVSTPGATAAAAAAASVTSPTTAVSAGGSYAYLNPRRNRRRVQDIADQVERMAAPPARSPPAQLQPDAAAALPEILFELQTISAVTPQVRPELVLALIASIQRMLDDMDDEEALILLLS